MVTYQVSTGFDQVVRHTSFHLIIMCFLVRLPPIVRSNLHSHQINRLRKILYPYVALPPLKRHTNTQSSSFENAFIMVKCSLSAQMSAGFASSQHTHPSTVLPAHCKTKSLKCGGLVPIAYDCRLREPCVGIQIWELVATHGNRPERSFPSQSSGEGSVDVLGNLA
jgi:hypothetical protein